MILGRIEVDLFAYNLLILEVQYCRRSLINNLIICLLFINLLIMKNRSSNLITLYVIDELFSIFLLLVFFTNLIHLLSPSQLLDLLKVTYTL